ncbi:hypothetical protein PG994_015234 [Apiospora phragmitis]|uniref:Uncharacterized protein n=1 Tax=Apiospora phragmitis TaxID=2905665 RepID=A0ABR1SQY2_9PEZI
MYPRVLPHHRVLALDKVEHRRQRRLPRRPAQEEPEHEVDREHVEVHELGPGRRPARVAGRAARQAAAERHGVEAGLLVLAEGGGQLVLRDGVRVVCYAVAAAVDGGDRGEDLVQLVDQDHDVDDAVIAAGARRGRELVRGVAHEDGAPPWLQSATTPSSRLIKPVYPRSHRFHALIPAFHQPSPNPPQYDDRRSNDAPRCRRRLGHGRRTTPNLESPVCDEQRPRLDLCHSTAHDQQIIIDYESLRSWSGSVICA